MTALAKGCVLAAASAILVISAAVYGTSQMNSWPRIRVKAEVQPDGKPKNGFVWVRFQVRLTGFSSGEPRHGYCRLSIETDELVCTRSEPPGSEWVIWPESTPPERLFLPQPARLRLTEGEAAPAPGSIVDVEVALPPGGRPQALAIVGGNSAR